MVVNIVTNAIVDDVATVIINVANVVTDAAINTICGY